MTLGDGKDSFAADLLKAVSSGGANFCWASVEYRLAPEDRFPAGIDDFVSVAMSLKDVSMSAEYGYSARKIGLAGVCGGAYVAAHAACRLAVDKQAPAFVGLLYPMVDPSMLSRCHQLYGDLPACPAAWLRLSWNWLLADESGAVTEARIRQGSLLHDHNMASLQTSPLLLVLAKSDPKYGNQVALCNMMLSAGLQLKFVNGKGSHALAHIFDAEAKQQILQWFQEVLSSTPRKDQDKDDNIRACTVTGQTDNQEDKSMMTGKKKKKQKRSSTRA